MGKRMPDVTAGQSKMSVLMPDPGPHPWGTPVTCHLPTNPLYKPSQLPQFPPDFHDRHVITNHAPPPFEPSFNHQNPSTNTEVMNIFVKTTNFSPPPRTKSYTKHGSYDEYQGNHIKLHSSLVYLWIFLKKYARKE